MTKNKQKESTSKPKQSKSEQDDTQRAALTSKNRKFGAALSMANMLSSAALGIIYTPILLRCLGQNEYGIYSLASSAVAFLAILDLGLGNTLVRYASRFHAQKKSTAGIYGLFLALYSGISILSLVAGGFIYFNVESFFAQSFTPGEISLLKNIILVLIANVAISFPASVFSSIIRSNQRFIFCNLITLIANLGRHLATIIALLIGFKSMAVVALSLFTTIACFIINASFCFKKLKIKISFERPPKALLKEILLYSLFILINIIVDQLYANTDNIILGRICGSAAVAVYTIGTTFQAYFTEFSTSISGVFLPHISELSTKKDGMKEISALFIKVARIQFLVLGVILCGFIAFGQDFVRIWAGKDYADAFYIALVIMIPSIIPLTQNIGISVLQALNIHKYRSMIYLVIAIINIIISIPLAAKMGGFGAACGTMIANLLGQIGFMNYFYHKKTGLDIAAYWRQAGKLFIKLLPILAIFLIGAKSFANPNSAWASLILRGTISVAVAAPYFFFVLLNKDERNMIKNRLNKIFKRA